MGNSSKNLILLKVLGLFCVSQSAFAAGSLNHYQSFIEFSGIKSAFNWTTAQVHDWQVVFGALLVTAIFIVLGLFYKKRTDAIVASDVVAPRGLPSLFGFVDLLVEFVRETAENVIGPNYKNYLFILVPLFFFIFLSNLTGLVPGFPPPTESISTNISLGLLVFFLYNFAGFREHGVSYINQFLGPFLLLAPLILAIEVISHCIRPISLALRLYANIFGDHLLVGIFSSLTVTSLGFPALLLLFGLLVAFIQSLVFTLLTSIYISMAESHDH